MVKTQKKNTYALWGFKNTIKFLAFGGGFPFFENVHKWPPKSDPAVVGALELPWPVGGQASVGRLVVLLAVLWGDPMYASPERKSREQRRQFLSRCLRGLWYLLLVWMWRKLRRRWMALSLIRILRLFCRRHQTRGTPLLLPETTQPSPFPPQHQSRIQPSARQAPSLRSPVGANGSGERERPVKLQDAKRSRTAGPLHRGQSGESLDWAVPYLSSSIMQ